MKPSRVSLDLLSEQHRSIFGLRVSKDVWRSTALTAFFVSLLRTDGRVHLESSSITVHGINFLSLESNCRLSACEEARGPSDSLKVVIVTFKHQNLCNEAAGDRS